MFNRRRKKREDKGFLCPSCMQSFGSAEEVQQHYDEHHSDQNGHETEAQGEGFLCPVCKISLASAEVLQSHYVAEHSEDTNSDPSHIRNGEITGVEIQELRRKLELLQTQLRGSEERSSLMSSEMFNNKQKVAQFSMQLEIVKAEKEELETKAAELVKENASLKLKIDEFEHQRKITGQHQDTLMRRLDETPTYVKHVEIQLADSGTGKVDSQETVEVLTLRQQLTTAQALIDQMRQDRLKQVDSFQSQQAVLQSSLSERESALHDLKTSLASLEIDFMQEKYKREKLQEQLRQSAQIADGKQASVERLQEEVSQAVQEKTNLQNILQTTQSHLQQIQSELASKEDRLHQSLISLEECVQNTLHLQAALDDKDKTVKLIEEREIKATHTVGDLQAELDIMKAAVSDRTRQLEDLRRLVADSESTSQLALLQKDQQINELTSKVNKLQSDLQVKLSEMADLQDQLSDSNSILENERHHCEKLKARVMELDGQLEEKERKLTQLEDQVRGLENRVECMSAEKHRLDTERQHLVAKIETGEGASELIHQIQQENSSLQEKLSSLESAHQSQVCQHFNQEEALLKQIREVRGQLKESEAKVSTLETNMEEKSTTLKTVQQKLLETESKFKVQTELLLTSATTRANQIDALEKEIIKANISLEEAGSDLSNTKLQLEQANRDLAASKERIGLLVSEVSEQKDKLATADQKIVSLELQLKEKNTRLTQAELEKTDMELTLDANRQILMDSKGKLIKAELDLQMERRSKVIEIDELTKKLEVLTHDRNSLQQKCEQVSSRITDVESKHSEKCRELDVVSHNLTSTQEEFKKMEDMLRTTKENADGQLMYLTTEFEKEKSRASEIKEDLIKQVNSLTEERKLLKEEKMAFGEQVMNLSETLQQNISESESIKQQMHMEKQALEADMDNLRTELLEAKTQADEYRRQVSNVNHLLTLEQEEKQQTLAVMTASKDVLLQQKMVMEAELIQLQGQSEHWSEQLATEKQKAQEVQTALREENSALLDKMVSSLGQNNSALLDKMAALQLALETLQKEKDEIEAEFDTQSTLLSENLTTVRTDLTIAEGSLDELTRVNEQLRGERIELEVKLERCNDERRALVERCIASERECEKLREHVAEQRYRLEDIQGALHELGRENQTLQVTTTTVQGRKWTDDSDVTECTSCGKMFSVIVRKHHCRHCGHIFCNDCSSKITQTPMKRKASRVCDPCYRELSSQKL
ncbi:hypothetical protein BsWGS_13797 [Bradybaena similaris]